MTLPDSQRDRFFFISSEEITRDVAVCGLSSCSTMLHTLHYRQINFRSDIWNFTHTCTVRGGLEAKYHQIFLYCATGVWNLSTVPHEAHVCLLCHRNQTSQRLRADLQNLSKSKASTVKFCELPKCIIIESATANVSSSTACSSFEPSSWGIVISISYIDWENSQTYRNRRIHAHFGAFSCTCPFPIL